MMKVGCWNPFRFCAFYGIDFSRGFSENGNKKEFFDYVWDLRMR
jgi:hypothetical protein